MISANLRYRNVVPWNYFAIECSNLRFDGNGDLVFLLNKIRSLIEFEKYNKNKALIDELDKMKKSTYEEWTEWNKEISNLKRKHLLWVLSKEHREEMSVLKEECSKLASTYEYADRAIEDLENSSYFDAVELTVRFKQLLSKLGFTCKSSLRNESNLYTEIYESTCSDEELFKRAKQMITKLEAQQKYANQENSLVEENYEDLNYSREEKSL